MMNELSKITVLHERLKKIRIDTIFTGNYPWIYIDRINDKKVTEKFMGNHGFTVAFLPVRIEDKMKFTDITEIFKLLRKYR